MGVVGVVCESEGGELLAALRCKLSAGGVRTQVLFELTEFRSLLHSTGNRTHLVCLLAPSLFSRAAHVAKCIREAKRHKISVSYLVPELVGSELFKREIVTNALVKAGLRLDPEQMLLVEKFSAPVELVPFPHLELQSRSHLGSFCFTAQSRCLLFAIQNLYCQFNCEWGQDFGGLGKELELCARLEGDLVELFRVLVADRFPLVEIIVLRGVEWCSQQSELVRLVNAFPGIQFDLVKQGEAEGGGEQVQEIWGEMTIANLALKITNAFKLGSYSELLQQAKAEDEMVYELLLLSQSALLPLDPQAHLPGQVVGRMAKRFPHHRLVEDAKSNYQHCSLPLDHFSGLQQVGGSWKHAWPHACPVYAVGCLPNGNVVSACWDGALRVFSPTQREVLQVVTQVCGGNAALVCLQVETEGVVCVASAKGAIAVLDHLLQVQYRLPDAHSKQVTCLAVDRNMLYSGSQDCTVKRWDLVSGSLLSMYSLRESVSSLLVVGELLYVASCDLYLSVYGGDWDGELRAASGHSGEITCMANGGDAGGLITGSLDGMIRLFAPPGAVSISEEDDRLLLLVGQIDCKDQPVRSLVVTAAGGRLIVGTDRVRVFDLRTLRPVLVLEDSPFVISQLCLLSSSSPSQLLVLSQHSQVDLYTLDLLKENENEEEAQMLTSVCLNFEFGVTCSLDHNLTVWELASGKKRGMLCGHTDVVCATDLNAQSLLVSGSLDQTCRVWDCRTLVQLCVLPHSGLVFNCFVSIRPCLPSDDDDDGHLIVTGSEPGPRFFTPAGRELELQDFSSLSEFETMFAIPDPVHQFPVKLDGGEPGELKRHGEVVFGPVGGSFLVWKGI